MKKYLLVTVLLFQMVLVFGQTCEQRLKTVIDGFNGFNNCNQRAEMNRLLAVATTVIKECPVYYAEHEAEFLKAKKFVETSYEKLGCQINGIAGTGANSTAGTANNNSLQNILQQQQSLQQQPPLSPALQQASNQLATGIVGLIMANQTNKARKRQEELANFQADKQLLADANKGDFSKQIKLAETYVDHGQFTLAEYYYGLAMQNTKETESTRNNILDEYVSTLALQGKKKEVADIFNVIRSNHIDNSNANIAFMLLEIFCEDFSVNAIICGDSAKTEGVRGLLALQTDSAWVKPIICYMQVTGGYEKYGVPKDKEGGLKMLEQMTKEKGPHDVALYYLGMIYLNGTPDIKKNEGKGFRYFLKSAYYKGGSMSDLRQAPFQIKDTYAYFNYRLFSYIKVAWFLSRSNAGIDASIAATTRAEVARYRYLIPNSDKQYFPEFGQ